MLSKFSPGLGSSFSFVFLKVGASFYTHQGNKVILWFIWSKRFLRVLSHTCCSREVIYWPSLLYSLQSHPTWLCSPIILICWCLVGCWFEGFFQMLMKDWTNKKDEQMQNLTHNQVTLKTNSLKLSYEELSCNETTGLCFEEKKPTNTQETKHFSVFKMKLYIRVNIVGQ